MKYYDPTLALLEKLYMHLTFRFSKDGFIPKNKEIQAQKLIYDQYLDELPTDIAEKISDSHPFSDVWSFLSDCHSKWEVRTAQRDKEMKVIAEKLGGVSLSSAFEYIISDDEFPAFQAEGTHISILFQESYSYRRFMILHDAATDEGILPTPSGAELEWAELYENEGQYCLEFRYFLFDQEESHSNCIRFSSAEIRNAVFNAIHVPFFQHPWQYLGAIAAEIIEKSEMDASMLNNQEWELLPLCKDLSLFCIRNQEENHFAPTSFCKLASSLGFHELSAGKNTITKLLVQLFQPKYEPLWRHIYQALSMTQNTYTSKLDFCFDPIELERMRREITDALHQNGFSGTYPHFHKKAEIPGFRVMESYNNSYIVSREKDTDHYITCLESHLQEPGLHFLCGFRCDRAKYPDNDSDFFSCMFNANGKRCYQTLAFFFPDPDLPASAPSLSEFISVAVKKAMLVKLTSEERKSHWFQDASDTRLPVFLFSFLAGLFFGAAMTLCFILIELLIALLFTGSFQEFTELFCETPWGFVFLGTGLPFGLTLGILMALGRKK